MINAKNISVLIPAAGRVPDGIIALGNVTCPAMVPVAGRPVIHWTTRYLRELGLHRFSIAVAERGMFVEDFVECSFGSDCQVNFFVPKLNQGLGRTVLELALQAEGDAALIVLGDTFFQFADAQQIDSDQPFVLVHGVDDSSRWCIAESDSNGNLVALHDKQPDLPAPLRALVGVYYFPKLEQLRRAAVAANDKAQAAGKRTEMSDILREVMVETPIAALPAGDWLDCGNPDMQATAHVRLLQKRDFNELKIDNVLGTVTKRSRHVEKFLDEVNYFRLLPANLAIMFPRVVGFSTAWEDSWVTLEYYGYPTLAEMFVFENVAPAAWERVFEHLLDVLTLGFGKVKRPLAPGMVREMYLGKTRKRLESMTGPAELVGLVKSPGELTVNGRKLQNLPTLWPRLETEVAHLEKNADGCVIHGDLCLSNILYDLRCRICKLLDPRGSFGTSGIYGDPRYDVAKLYHSVYGLYDFIVNDLFRVNVQGNQVQLDIRSRPYHAEICRRFERVFFPTFARREILLITAFLFASMPALHYDVPQRQLAMYTRALQLFDESLRLPK
jgi:dTDP-glucose pyrophosphorylase